MFRKMDDGGRLVFERHIEGLETRPGIIQGLPTTWPRRKPSGDGVDGAGRPARRQGWRR